MHHLQLNMFVYHIISFSYIKCDFFSSSSLYFLALCLSVGLSACLCVCLFFCMSLSLYIYIYLLYGQFVLIFRLIRIQMIFIWHINSSQVCKTNCYRVNVYLLHIDIKALNSYILPQMIFPSLIIQFFYSFFCRSLAGQY